MKVCIYCIYIYIVLKHLLYLYFLCTAILCYNICNIHVYDDICDQALRVAGSSTYTDTSTTNTATTAADTSLMLSTK